MLRSIIEVLSLSTNLSSILPLFYLMFLFHSYVIQIIMMMMILMIMISLCFDDDGVDDDDDDNFYNYLKV